MKNKGLKYLGSVSLIFVLVTLSSFQHLPEDSKIIMNDTFSMVKCSEDFENNMLDFYNDLDVEENLSFEAFRFGMIGYYNMKCEGLLRKDELFTIIDYTKSANLKRLFVIDIKNKELVYNTLVAHGRNTGNEMAEYFSNRGGSKMSSIGFFTTAETYDGRHKYSLKIDGLELTNSNVRNRGVVFHGADYVCESYIEHSGRIGRSNGCPALPQELNRDIVDTIKGGSGLFIYYHDERYINNSKFLDLIAALQQYYLDNNTVSN